MCWLNFNIHYQSELYKIWSLFLSYKDGDSDGLVVMIDRYLCLLEIGGSQYTHLRDDGGGSGSGGGGCEGGGSGGGCVGGGVCANSDNKDDGD